MKDKDALAMWDERYGKAVHDIREEEEAQKGLTTLSTETALLTFHRGRRGYNVMTDR
jgi:hypothetical protein